MRSKKSVGIEVLASTPLHATATRGFAAAEGKGALWRQERQPE